MTTRQRQVRPSTPKGSGGEDKDLNELVKQLLVRVRELEEERDRVREKLDTVKEESKEMREAIKELKEEIKTRKEEGDRLREESLALREDSEKLKEENDELRRQLNSEMSEVKKNNEDMKTVVDKVEGEQVVWGKKTDEAEKSLKQIMEDQEKERKEMKNKIVSVIKEKEKLVRNTVDRVKCVVLLGLKEEKIVNRTEREQKEKECLGQVISLVTEDDQAIGAVEEHFRIGSFEEGKDRPVKVKFATQAMAEAVLNGAWRLSGVEEYKKVWINRDMDRQEREELRELVEEARQKNSQRTEEERKQFYWKVRDLRLRRIYVRK